MAKKETELTAEFVLKSFAAGGLGGMCGKTAVAPLDRVKILLQAQSVQYRQLGVAAGLLRIVRTEGVTALYKGNGAQGGHINIHGNQSPSGKEDALVIVYKDSTTLGAGRLLVHRKNHLLCDRIIYLFRNGYINPSMLMDDPHRCCEFFLTARYNSHRSKYSRSCCRSLTSTCSGRTPTK